MGNASIGQHTRHLIEVLQCLVNGYESGIINYDLRPRNLQLETNQQNAQKTLIYLSHHIGNADRKLQVAVSQSLATVNSTYFREILYNTDHIIHHLALIKVALRCLALPITNDNFGLAYATIVHQNT